MYSHTNIRRVRSKVTFTKISNKSSTFAATLGSRKMYTCPSLTMEETASKYQVAVSNSMQ